MRAFIVRPFGKKEGIDFDEVERELIDPALKKLGIEGRTTAEITKQGNIREDMFRLLVLSDIVIADISIYNANVFYELGIRHGLQERHTLLIRAEGSTDKYPFDLQTDRYFVYDSAEPAKKGEKFFEALRSTIASTDKDSPVFKLLPRLRPHSRQSLMVVPWDFQEEVARAKNASRAGDLRLLAEEVQGFEWSSGGLRLVGEAQFEIRALAGAKVTFEALRRLDADDVQANYRLGTIYQKLAEGTSDPERKADLLMRSEQAIVRVLEFTRAPSHYDESPEERAERRFHRAEGHALLGSNAKTRWLEQWMPVAPDLQRKKALTSPYLTDSIQHYLAGFAQDLGSFFPGINALAMLKIQLALAAELPAIWAENFDDEEAAASALKESERRASRIAATLYLALGLDNALARRDETSDIWKEITKADLLFLTLDKPPQIGSAYRKALKDCSPFHIAAARRNVMPFQDLGLCPSNVRAALDEMPPAALEKNLPPARVVLFTGHMLDAPGRAADRARFPHTPEAERVARKMIEEVLRNEVSQEGGVSFAIAGGACGGDILFHEICESLDVKDELYLALPEPDFQVKSVNRGGPEWVERYRYLCRRTPPRVLSESKDLPSWLVDKNGYDIWQRTNLWMMFNALASQAQHLTLIALYNRERESDGPGGTAHFVEIASKWEFKIVKLDARELLKT